MVFDRFYSFVEKKYKKEHNREKIVRRNNGYLSNKVFYVIRIDNIVSGIMSIAFSHVLEWIKYCLDEDYIPVVLIGDNNTVYNSFNRIGKYVNIWEYWFEQPTQFGLLDIKQADYVIYGKAHKSETKYFCHYPVPFLYDKQLLSEACDIAAKYIHIRTSIYKEIRNKYGRIFDGNNRILGVCYRLLLSQSADKILYGDFWNPNLPTLLRRIDSYMNTGEYDYIYLYTSDKEAKESIREKYGNKCIVMERVLSDDYSPKYIKQQYKDNYLFGKEYIVDTILLSRCTSLVGGINSGTVSAIVLNNLKYEMVDLFNVGDGSNYTHSVNSKIVDWCLSNTLDYFPWSTEGNIEKFMYYNDWN